MERGGDRADGRGVDARRWQQLERRGAVEGGASRSWRRRICWRWRGRWWRRRWRGVSRVGRTFGRTFRRRWTALAAVAGGCSGRSAVAC